MSSNGKKKVNRKKLGILIIIIGLFIPLISLVFSEGYLKKRGFIGSLPRMEVVFQDEVAYWSKLRNKNVILRRKVSYPYRNFLGGGLIIVFIGSLMSFLGSDEKE